MSWYKKAESKFGKTRSLGQTGWQVPLFSLGGQSILESTSDKDKKIAQKIIKKFLKLGGNYIDTSPIYSEVKNQRQSEKNIGQAIKSIKRNSFYLATKTEEREENAAWKDINMSVETLQTCPDCIQIHHLGTKKEVDKVFSKQGAMKAALRAKKEGLTKYIGITGHTDPKVLLYALKKYPFDTVLGALNPADAFLNDTSFQKELIPYCEENKIGFIAMKVCSRGALFNPGGIKTIADSLKYIWSFPISTAIIGINSMEQLEHNFDLSKKFVKLDQSEKEEIEQQVNKEYIKQIMYFNKNGNDKLWKIYGDGKKTPFFVI